MNWERGVGGGRVSRGLTVEDAVGQADQYFTNGYN